MNERERSRRHINAGTSPMPELLAKLIICGVLFCAAYFLKTAFPEAAEVVSNAVLGDGSYREVFAELGGSETVAEAFAAITNNR